MTHSKKELIDLLKIIDFGSSIAENDNLLETARVETSVFGDLLRDRVDLIPGTKGSGKSALFRIFVEFLPNFLLDSRKVVVAHGIKQYGDEVFSVYNESFKNMTEEEFVDFWCIYLVSLANEQFIKGPRYASYFKECTNEIANFRQACKTARIPEFDKPKPLKDVLGWVLSVLNTYKPRPTMKYRPQNGSGEYELDLFGDPTSQQSHKEATGQKTAIPHQVLNIIDSLKVVLNITGLSLWLMVDRLDEIFPRRSKLETRALRGLLKTLRIFESNEIRVKVFLRDDILHQIVSTGQGFTALTHVTSRQADTLRWSEAQILTMIIMRLYTKEMVLNYLEVDPQRLEASPQYQNDAFYKVFPPAIAPGTRQSTTLRWIYNHTADGNGVVTPRDVIDLLTKAKQKQQDDFSMDPSGESDFVIGPTAIKYGLKELSQRKRDTFLQAEFPHLWRHIKKFIGGKTQYSEDALRDTLGKQWASIVDDLTSIGLMRKEGARNGQVTFKFPFLYRDGLQLTQGRVERVR